MGKAVYMKARIHEFENAITGSTDDFIYMTA